MTKIVQFAYIVAGIAGIIALCILLQRFATRKGEDKAYNRYTVLIRIKLFNGYSIDNATYVDNQLEIVLYKHHLLATYKNFQVYDLTKAEQFTTTFILKIIRSHLLTVLLSPSNRTTNHTVERKLLYIRTLGTKQMTYYNHLSATCSKPEFPDGLLGYENKSKSHSGCEDIAPRNGTLDSNAGRDVKRSADV